MIDLFDGKHLRSFEQLVSFRSYGDQVGSFEGGHPGFIMSLRKNINPQTMTV